MAFTHSGATLGLIAGNFWPARCHRRNEPPARFVPSGAFHRNRPSDLCGCRLNAQLIEQASTSRPSH